MATEMDAVLFTFRDLEALIRLSCDLTLKGEGRSDRIVRLVSELKRLVRAENACIFESRGEGPGSMHEVHRDEWRDWHSDALSNELTGRPIAKVGEHPISMIWVGPAKPGKNRLSHALASCLPAGVNYLITLAFARRAEPFTDREVAILQAVHRSELIQLISPMRAPTTPDLTQRMRQVISRLMEGDSEKQIAIHLSLSRHTVHAYIKSIYRRYGVNSRGELLSLSVDPVARRQVMI